MQPDERVRAGWCVHFLQALNYFPRYGYSMFDKLTRDGGVTYMTTVTLIFQSDDADGSTAQCSRGCIDLHGSA